MKIFLVKALVLLAISGYSQGLAPETIKLFKTRISSEDVNGSYRFGPRDTPKISKITTFEIDPYDQNLGRLITKERTRSSNAFIDLILNYEYQGFIDSIHMKFLTNRVVLNYDIADSVETKIPGKKWAQFRDTFMAGVQWPREQKKFLWMPENQQIRKFLETKVYRRIFYNVQQNHAIERGIKADLIASVKSVIKENKIEMTADLEASIEKMVSSNLTVQGRYSDLRVEQPFVDELKYALRNFPKRAELFAKDRFLSTYFRGAVDGGGYLAVSYSVLQFDLNYATEKDVKTSIETLLKGQGKLNESTVASVTARVYASITSKKKIDATSNAKINYLVRYGYDPDFDNIRDRFKTLVDKFNLLYSPM